MVDACASLHPVNDSLVGWGAWWVRRIEVLEKRRPAEGVVQRGGVPKRFAIEVFTYDGCLGAKEGDELLNSQEHALFLCKAVMGSQVDGDQEVCAKSSGFDDQCEPLGAVHGHVGGGRALNQCPCAYNQEPRACSLRAADDKAITLGDAVA